MAGGSATTLGGIPDAAAAYVVGCILPFIFYFIGTDSDHLSPFLAAQAVVMVCGLLFASRSVHGTFIENVRARLDANRKLEEFERARADWLEVAAISDGFALIGPNGRLRLWNDVFSSYFRGIEISTATTMEELVTSLVPIDPRTSAITPEERRAKFRDLLLPASEPLTERLGDGRWVQANMQKTSNGNIVWLMRLVTREREREEAEARLRAQLGDAKQLQTIGQFSGGIAHDFNNVLAAVRAFAEIIELDDDSTDSVKHAAKRIIVAADRGAGMVSNILQFASVLHVEKAEFRFSDSFASTITLISRACPGNVKLESIDNAEDLVIHANESQIGQVIFNLVTNAIKAMERRHGTVRVTATAWQEDGQDVSLDRRLATLTERRHVYPDNSVGYAFGSLGPGRPCLRITVDDEGEGIDPEILERIFEPFVTTKTTTMRTGFGLAVVKSVVLLSGGALEVRTRPSQGTTFTIWLPVHSVSTERKPLATSRSLRGTERILIVDDDSDVADGMAIALGAFGYRATAINHPHKALMLFRDRPRDWDFAVLDHAMPEMTGDVLAREMRAIQPQLPIVIYTGLASERIEKDARDIGVRTVLRKPIDPTYLAGEIRKACDDHMPSFTPSP